MELGGFEPPTSSMPWKRATNCAIAPSAGVVPCGRRGLLYGLGRRTSKSAARAVPHPRSAVAVGSEPERFQPTTVHPGARLELRRTAW